VFRSRLEAAADADVQPFGVLAEHDEVDIGRASILQWTQTLVEQTHRAIVDVQVELEARAEQNIASMTVVGNARGAERADEHGVELVTQHRVPVRRNGDARLQIVIGAPGQDVEVEPAAEDLRNPVEDLDCFCGDLDANPVAWNDCYSHVASGITTHSFY